jgi:flagellar hook assembly protein FlgD/sugar lactone lactonase YvrE
MEIYKQKITKGVALFALLLLSVMLSGYTFDRQYPIDNYQGVTANYGQYRRATGTYQMHDGIDLRARTRIPVYAVASGEASRIELGDWGNCVIVTTKSNGESFETIYAHLSRFSEAIGDLVANNSNSTVAVSAGEQIGISGSSGSAAKGQPHLHFGVGPTIGLTTNTEVNPITNGLKIQADDNFGDATFCYPYGNQKIVFWDGSKVVSNSAPGKALNIITEAYQKALFPTTPYMVKYKISKIGDPSYENQANHQKQIKFDDANLLSNDNWMTRGPFRSIYSTQEISQYNYLYWTPEAEGTYTVEAKVYVAYWQGDNLICPSNDYPERGRTQTIQRTIEIRDHLYSMIDPTGMYAWIPSVATGSSAVRSSTTSWPSPKYATDLSNTVFTTNPAEVAPDFPKNTVFTYSAMRDSDFLIRIKDAGGTVRQTLAASGTEGEISWDGAGMGEGTYSYQIMVKDKLTGTVSTKEGISPITIDNTKPLIMATVFPSKQSITQTEETTSIQFNADEDLTSCVVNIVNAYNHDRYIVENLGNYPRLASHEAVNLTWDGAGYSPDGTYQFEVVMTDLAGNINKRYSNPIAVNISGSYISPSIGVGLLVPPTYEERAIVTDFASDAAGNQYILYGRLGRVIKYNQAGEKIAEDDQRISLVYPLALAVSPTTGRVYVADTYNNQIVVYNDNLQYQITVSSPAVNMLRKRKLTDWYCGGLFRSGSMFSDPEQGATYFDGALYKPTEIYIAPDGRVYIVDSLNHRVLRYQEYSSYIRPGDIFEGIKMDGTKKDDESVSRDGSWFHTMRSEQDYLWSSSINNPVSSWLIWIRNYNLGMPAVTFGSADGQFTSPESIAVRPDGTIFVADTGNNRIQKFNPDGSFAAKYGEGILSMPKGVDVDSFGNVWVADTGNQRIVQFDRVGATLAEYKSDEYSINPQKLKVISGCLYIADANHDKPLVWNIGGALANVRTSSRWFASAKGLQEPLTVTYNLTQPAAIAMRLIPQDEAGKKALGETGISLLSNAARGIGPTTEVWTGNAETAIPDGHYQLKVIAAFGDYVKSQSVDLNIDNTPPVVNLDRAPPAISPSGANNKLKVDYTITDNLAPTAEVKLSVWKNGKVLDVLHENNDYCAATPTAYTLDWNGLLGRYLIEGNYILELKVSDLAGNTVSATKEVLVDAQPPRLENVSLSNRFFSPNRDGRKDNTELSFYLADNYAVKMPVTLLVEDKEGKEAATIAKRLELEAGQHTFTWEGSALPDGDYALRLYAEDDAGNLGTCEPQAVAIDTVPPTIENFAVKPNPFTPNNDGVNDKTTFSYKLSEPSYANTVIEQADGKLFRKYFQNLTVTSAESVAASWSWDGRGSRYELLGGNYNYYLMAEDRAGNVTSSEVASLYVDCSPSLVPYLFSSPDPFSPTNSRNGQTNLNYYLVRDNVRVSLNIIGQDGAVLKRLVKGEVQGKGEHKIAWDGSYDPDYTGPKNSRNSSKITDGTYEFRLMAEDLAGGEPADITNTVLVDTVTPNILTYPVNINYEEKRAALKYVIPETASVEVVAYNAANEPVSTLVDKEEQGPGEHWAVFKQPSTSYREPTYLKVSAVDRALNSAEKVSELFSVVPLETLQITGTNAVPGTFTPNNDGLLDQTRFAYRLSGGAPEYRVDVRLLNETGATVRTITQNDPETSGYYSFYWEGKNDAGLIVPDGHYRGVIEATDKLGTFSRVEIPVLLVATRPTVSVTAGLPTFSPNGDGAKDNVDLNYSINYATRYISGEALAKLEVLNATGEAVWSRVVNKTAGSYVYNYDGLMDNGLPLPAGDYYVRISGQDALGSLAAQQTVPLTVDYSNPEPTDFSVSHAYAKLNDEVTVSLSFPELLAEEPTVRFVKADGTAKSAVLVAKETNNYTYQYIVGAADADGLATVEVAARDLAFNPVLKTKTLVIDKTNPAVSGLSITPNPASVLAVSGQVVIKFNTSELLKKLPLVTVTQQGGTPTSSIVHRLSSLEYEASFEAVSGYDGPALITIETVDLANNDSRFTTPDSLLIDTIPPAFSGLACTIDSNPAHNKQAKEGATATIRFMSSELLKLNPEVRVNGNPAVYDALTAGEYVYKYTVVNTDQNGTAEVTVSGYDFAGNSGSKTSLSPESFVIDLVSPLVGISTEAGMIANPGHFATNASAKEVDLQTTLLYELNEPGFVTTRVYKVKDDQINYARTDFTADKLVTTLESGVYKEAGQQFTIWDGKITSNQVVLDLNANGYADPGKYAFLVEVRDRAGNLTQHLWGGTVWVQDNALKVQEPDQTVRGGTNPNPLYFSPKNNPADPAYGSAKYWFKVLLGVTPKAYAEPERIEVMALPGEIAWLDGVAKKGGHYTAKVYDDSGNLVRVLESAEFVTATDYCVSWEGKNEAGQYVPDGKYYLRVDVRDYLGGQALENLMTREVYVDNTYPEVIDNQAGDDAWRNAPGTTYEVGFRDTGTYASKLALAQYRVRKGDGSGYSAWADIAGVNGNVLFNASWEVNFDASYCAEGKNDVYVRAQDIAGNIYEPASPVFYVKKDTQGPIGLSLAINDEASETNSTAVALTTGATDAASGVAKVVIRNDSAGWSGETDPGTLAWTLNNIEGARTVTVMFRDNVGNWSNPFAKSIIYRTMPVISGLSVGNASFNPYSAANYSTVNFTAADSPAGLQSVIARIKRGATVIREWSLGTSGSYSFTWDGKNSSGDYVNEGDYSLEIAVTDNAGNTTTDTTKTITIWDDVNISNDPEASEYPLADYGNNNLFAQWFEGTENIGASVSATGYAGSPVTGIGTVNTAWSAYTYFTIDYDQQVTVTTSGYMSQWDLDGSTYSAATKTMVLAAGSHKVRVIAYIPSVWSVDSDLFATVNVAYLDTKYRRYRRISTDQGVSWTATAFAGYDDPPPAGRLMVEGKDYLHRLYLSGNNLFYERRRYSDGATWNAKLTNSGMVRRAALTKDANSEDCFAVWQDGRGTNEEIYFQKIPVKFAPVSGNPDSMAKTAALKMTGIVAQSVSFEAPVLTAPTNNTSSVVSIRPALEWQHRKGGTVNYRIDVAKNETFSIAGQTFAKAPNAGSPDKTDPTLFNYTYAIHEFDPGLEPTTYYWKVTALTTGEAATSEVWSFTIAPELTLAGVTNFPNPFNPNKEKTKIRYRLGADADEVKIRIYNIAGALVSELDGTTNGESSSIWSKYNDVEWDGRNGRGDLVMNGIYPFEVTARLGTKSLSGRGKIAVLK